MLWFMSSWSISDKIAFWQLIVAIFAGILGILGYFRIIKDTNQNAKDTQAAIRKTTEEAKSVLQNVTDTFMKGEKRNLYLMLAFMAIITFAFMWISSIVLDLKKDMKGRL